MFVFSLCNADPLPHPHTRGAKTIQPMIVVTNQKKNL